MTTSEKINIAFAIDAKYIPHLETLIKSICYYNKNVNFYVLHNDIPQEWFEGIQFKLEKMGYNLFSIRIYDDIFKDYKTLEHISSSSSYYRLMIPKLINQDRVLYLDSDIIVNGSLSDFYYSDLNGAPVGVVKDYGMGEHFPFPYLDASVSRNYFNSGVLLIDCAKWRNEGLVNTLLQTVEEYGDQVLYGDQCILNIIYEKRQNIIVSLKMLRCNILKKLNESVVLVKLISIFHLLLSIMLRSISLGIIIIRHYLNVRNIGFFAI